MKEEKMEEITVSKRRYRMLKIYAVLISMVCITLMVIGYIKGRYFGIITNFELRPDNVYTNYTCLDLGVTFSENNRGASAVGACCRNNSTDCILRVLSCPNPANLKSCETHEFELNPPKAIRIIKE
jgi:hypothetical protein